MNNLSFRLSKDILSAIEEVRAKEEKERQEEEEKLAKLKEEKAAIEAAKEKEKENSSKADSIKTEKKSEDTMETEDDLPLGMKMNQKKAIVTLGHYQSFYFV